MSLYWMKPHSIISEVRGVNCYLDQHLGSWVFHWPNKVEYLVHIIWTQNLAHPPICFSNVWDFSDQSTKYPYSSPLVYYLAPSNIWWFVGLVENPWSLWILQDKKKRFAGLLKNPWSLWMLRGSKKCWH